MAKCENKGCDCEDQVTPHPCPYKSEIHNDEESLCTCCKDCEYQCSQDI